LPEVAGNCVALDTGAYGTARLTALIIDPSVDDFQFASTFQSGAEITVGVVDPVMLPGRTSASAHSR
jgi:hypothetical protein